ncbi:MAG: hypothetical protein CAPSK01_003667 [Candidatus Accumulibacter vicinus]|uniref:Uncharacterized protein n=1 Tax=Candidatus Accumulibacter vicinus TaxID=2954382 RepID=A0A084XW85_9PROT|nr:MAG: hypothetical protein CAPSK01_003667 [Candidatus Accumulibacter vicinus]
MLLPDGGFCTLENIFQLSAQSRFINFWGSRLKHFDRTIKRLVIAKMFRQGRKLSRSPWLNSNCRTDFELAFIRDLEIDDSSDSWG